MNDREIARIERAVGCALPSSYSTLLRRFPPELESLLRLRRPDSRMLFTEAATIIQWNRYFRDPAYEFENSEGEICGFPDHHIVIGANSGGDFFHLTSRKRTPEVLFWSHEDGEFTRHAKTLGEFVRKIFSGAADTALDGLGL